MGIAGNEPTQYKLMPIMGKSFDSHDIGQKKQGYLNCHPQ